MKRDVPNYLRRWKVASHLRLRKTKLVIFVCLSVCLFILSANSHAQSLPLFDDFKDGNADGWLVPSYSSEGTREVVDGNFVMTGRARNNALDADWGNEAYGDISIHTLFRISAEDSAGVYARSTLERINGRRTGYQPWAVLDGNGQLTIGRSLNNGVSFLRQVRTGWDPTGQDVHMQFDVLGHEASATVWLDGTDQPEPQITVNLPDERSFVDAGRIGIWTFQPGSGTLGPVEFRFVEANPLTLALPGDFDNDGVLTAADIDRLSTAIRDSSTDSAFDLTGDGTVDLADHSRWVTDLKHTWTGDANLDGEFNSGDLILVFQAARYEVGENAGWSEGDWTADGRFDTSDLIAAFTEAGYGTGPATAGVAAVPEPTAGSPLAALLAGLILTRQDSRSPTWSLETRSE